MKKVLLAAAVALTLAGCGKTGNKDAEADKNVSMFRSEEVVAKKQLSLPDSLNFYGKDAKVFTGQRFLYAGLKRLEARSRKSCRTASSR